MSTEQAQAGPQVAVQKIYLKDCSMEVPRAPEIFTKAWQPKIDVQLDTQIHTVNENTHEVVLKVTVTAKLEDDVAFLAEVQQAGIFQVNGTSNDEQLRALLGAWCPASLFPYLRESVSELVQRAGFPQFLLQPVNFDALYQQSLAQQAQSEIKH